MTSARWRSGWMLPTAAVLLVAVVLAVAAYGQDHWGAIDPTSAGWRVWITNDLD